MKNNRSHDSRELRQQRDNKVAVENRNSLCKLHDKEVNRAWESRNKGLHSGRLGINIPIRLFAILDSPVYESAENEPRVTNNQQVSKVDNGADRSSRRDLLKLGVRAVGAALLTPALLSSSRGVGASEKETVPNDLAYSSATALARLIRERKISPLELTQLHLARIKKLDPTLGAVEYLAEEQALKQALVAMRELSTGHVDWQRQPLFGVPMTIKDSLEVAGMPTTCGAPGLKNNVATEDATVVRGIKEAGAIILAKTRLCLLGTAHESSNLFGRTNNPYDLKRTSGGSSGGEAALIASGGSPLGLGVDGGASIRVPASYCGIAGLVPAWGRVSSAGMYPPADNIGNLLYCSVGPMARYVEDLALVLPIISGVDYRDPFTFPLLPLGDYRKVTLGDLRVGFWANTKELMPTQETIAVVENAAKALAELGAKVKRAAPPFEDLRQSADEFKASMYPSGIMYLRDVMKQYGAESDPLMIESIRIKEEWVKQHSPEELSALSAAYLSSRRRQRVFASMKDYDAILCPVTLRPAVSHGESWERIEKDMEYTYTYLYGSVYSLPTGTVRCGTSPEKLPIGIHVIGSPGREDIVLAVLSCFEKDLGGWKPPVL